MKIGDFVTRNSYNNDIVFEIISINNDIVYLKGVEVRLVADSNINDLVLIVSDFEKKDLFIPIIDDYRKDDRDEYFYLPGIILHIDGDKKYLEDCMNFYKKNKLKAYGIYLKEEEVESQIINLLNKYCPDIVVITGHDSYSVNRNEKYSNSKNFIKAVIKARLYEKSHDKLYIIAGACQSNYEELIKSGANFASSPKRVNIHALDPAVIASCLSYSNKNENIDLRKILNKTKYGTDGMGGIITRGSMYVGYPRK